MSEEDPTDDRGDEEVAVDDDEVEEASVEVDEDVTVEETLEVDEDGVEEEVTITEDGEERASVEEEIPVSTGEEGRPLSGTRERIEEEADRAVEGFDERVVDLLSWVLDTETRARIFVHLRKHPYSTSEEVAEGTGLYPSTVREALAELHDEGRVERRKRESEGAGNNPYEYTAMAPSELVSSIVGQVQDELNTVFNLDRHLGGETEYETETEPVSIRVEEEGDETGGIAGHSGEPGESAEDDGSEFGED